MSTVAEEIQRLKQAKSDIKASIINKGVAVDDTATLDAYPALIDSIQTGGSTTTVYKLKNGTKLGSSTFTLWNGQYDLSEIKDFSNFFYGVPLTGVTKEIDLSNCTSEVGMFRKTSFTNIDDTNFKLAGTEKMSQYRYFFADCGELDRMYATIDCSGAINLSSMFRNCVMLRQVQGIKNTQNVTNMPYMFYGCNNFDEFKCDKSFVTDSVTDITQMFYYSTVTSLPKWNFSNVTGYTGAFDGCTSLTTLAGFTGLKASLSLSDCPLTVESINNVINEMYDFNANGLIPEEGQGTLTLGATNLAKLSDAEKAVATNKGWTLA